MQPLGELDAVHPRLHDVGDHQIEALAGRDAVQRFGGRRGLEDLEGVFEVQSEQEPDVVVVVDDENSP